MAARRVGRGWLMALNGWMQARHILVVRLDNLGDVLVTSPAFGAIKRRARALE